MMTINKARSLITKAKLFGSVKVLPGVWLVKDAEGGLVLTNYKYEFVVNSAADLLEYIG